MCISFYERNLRLFPCVAPASSLARNRQVPGNWHQGSSKQFRLSHMLRIDRTDTCTRVLVGSRQEDMAASGCQQNNTSKLGGLDLLHQKVVDLAPPYSQCYGTAIWYTNVLSQ